ncbi:YcaO-like family protein [Streptomyces sp. NBC_00322]|uniref:YcaO-like family protein n=1 Tax=Streptomyces sp. NBC_00322 TaxID=2975712 RepID=UPI002E2CEEE3|nr:YcaO-like family protein [Streptomyces sp. NBC_00322]
MRRTRARAEAVRADWTSSCPECGTTTGSGVLSRRRVPVPVGLVHRSAARPVLQPDVFRATSTGLVCGNTRDEALLHAMYEVVERDALFTDEACARARRTLVDPLSVADPCRRMPALFGDRRAAGAGRLRRGTASRRGLDHQRDRPPPQPGPQGRATLPRHRPAVGCGINSPEAPTT